MRRKGWFDVGIRLSATVSTGRATTASHTIRMSIVPRSPFQTVVSRITAVCDAAAPCSLLSDLRERLERQGVPAAVAAHDTPALFDWLMPTLSYQGVSDAVAWGYMDRYGSVSHAEVAAALAAGPACPRLRCYWSYAECGFAKGAYTCGSPEHLDGCPVPRHDLRNGRLNQTAYSLALFLRDVCGGDLVGWLDARLHAADVPASTDRAAALRTALLEPLGCIYGVSAKVWSMALADLLLAGDPGRAHWLAAGAAMIAVATLVHNWMHRSGCLADLGADHLYGPGCYAPGGCASIIAGAAEVIDARRYCPEGPATFARLVQKAIWLLCTESGWDLCNGNRIDDRHACAQLGCPLEGQCKRLPLRPSTAGS